MILTEEIYKEDWNTSDGPRDVSVFKEALNHPQFKRVSLDYTSGGLYYSAEVVIIVTIERPETEEEIKKRYEQNRRNSENAKKAAETREKNRLEQERKEYERLKKKFDK